MAGSIPDKIPTFHPKWDEFKNFYEFLKRIEPEFRQYGLAKIVPPPEFVPSVKNYDNISAAFVINCPIRQYIMGQSGIYKFTNVVEKEKMTVKQFSDASKEMEETRSAREKKFVSEGNYENLQRAFWSNIMNHPPLYGADTEGSLFDEDWPGEWWNVAKLPSLLSEISERLKGPLPGVTNSMLYFGQWKSAFAWHTEDMNLYSINYLHFGARKQWYVVPAAYADKFTRVAQSLFASYAQKCPDFMRHKEFLISPQILKNHGIPVYCTTQSEREFIVTYPESYHAGFNYGFNCAESVNFAMEPWLPFGKKARPCVCAAKFDGSHDLDAAVFMDMAVVEKIIDDIRAETKTPSGELIRLPTSWEKEAKAREEKGEGKVATAGSPTVNGPIVKKKNAAVGRMISGAISKAEFAALSSSPSGSSPGKRKLEEETQEERDPKKKRTDE